MAFRAKVLRGMTPLRELCLQSVLSVRGLMQLLMQERNGAPWSAQDKTCIRNHLRQLGRVVPLLLVFALPGGGLLLPILAWLLDRRKQPRPDS